MFKVKQSKLSKKATPKKAQKRLKTRKARPNQILKNNFTTTAIKSSTLIPTTTIPVTTSQSNTHILTKHTSKRFLSTSIKHAPDVSLSQFSSDYIQERKQLEEQKLATQLGSDHYNFNSMTGMSEEYRPDPTDKSQSTTAPSDLPANADSLDVLHLLQKEQQLELEKRLFGVEDENEKAFIIYDVANNFQQKISKMKTARRNRLKMAIEQSKTALFQIKRIATSLNMLNVISLLRALSTGNPDIRLYRVTHLSQLHHLMLFYTCEDQDHLTLTSNALVDFVRTHPQFRDTAPPTTPVNPDLKLDGEVADRKQGELLVLSRNDFQWRMIDLGNCLVHLSYGHERNVSNMESLLQPFEIELHSSTNALARVGLDKCLEITPVSQVDTDDTLSLTDKTTGTDGSSKKM